MSELPRIIILDNEGRPVDLEDARILMEDELDAELQWIRVQQQHRGKYDPIAFMNKALILLDEISKQTLSKLQQRQN